MNLSLETIIAIMTALGIGGLAAKLLERLFSKQDRREIANGAMRGREIDDSAAMRRELWDRVTVLEEQVKVLSAELDRWKARYYEREALAIKVSALEECVQELTEQLEVWKGRYYEREAVVIQLRTDLEWLQVRVADGETRGP